MAVLWGSRVVLPQGRAAVLGELHETHPGCSKMKALARSYIWWPKVDQEIEDMVKRCSVCQENRPSPPSAPLHPWQWPTQPWTRLHLDFAGPYMGDMFLIIVDACSIWLDAYILSTISSSKTIETLRTVFATQFAANDCHRQRSSFTSEEFKLMEKNGIKHITSAPYHPSSNGQAERAVQTLKQGIKRTAGESVLERMSRFLFYYRITPHATTGVAACELLMNRKLRSRFELLYPMVRRKVEKCQEKQKELHDGKRDVRMFALRDPVYIENFTSRKSKWIPGTIVKVTGPLSYMIELQNGTTVRRHVDSIRKRESLNSEQDSDAGEPGFELIGVPVEPPAAPEEPEPQSQELENVLGEEPDAQPRV